MDARLPFHGSYSQLFFSRVLEGLFHQRHGVQCGHTVACLKAGTRNNSTANIVLLSKIDALDFTETLPKAVTLTFSRAANHSVEYLACRPRGGPGEQVRYCTPACTNTAVTPGYHLLRLDRRAPKCPPAVFEVLPILIPLPSFVAAAGIEACAGEHGRRKEPRPGPAFTDRTAITPAGRSPCLLYTSPSPRD